jgi:uncharacterized membrane protein YczE
LKPLYWRWLFFIAGLIILAFGISLTIKGQLLGISPWDVLHVGLYLNFGLTIGTWSIISGLVIVLGTVIGTKRYPKLGTWLNMILMGLFIDLFNWLLPDLTSYFGQTLFFVAGLFIMGIGVGVYVAPNVGAGPRDSLMLLLVEKIGWSVKRVRTGIEILVGVIGWALGGPIGIGTIIVAVILGQIVHITLPMTRNWLRYCMNENEKGNQIEIEMNL